MRALLILPFLVLSVRCSILSPDERIACTRGLVCMIKKETMDFFVVGDTGGIAVGKKKNNQSKPSETQLDVAKAMAQVASKQPIDFVVNVGDNIYANGATNASDPRFKTVFEEPYSDKSLQVPWYLIGGNHDHMGNVPAQFDYTKKSNTWTFPHYFYKAEYSFGKQNTKVDFIFIDTIVLCGLTLDDEAKPVNETEDVFETDKRYASLAILQWKWVEEQLKASTANYLFVSGHYPIFTINGKQVIKCLEKRLDPMLRKYKVTAYFAGHHHTLQYWYDDGKKSGQEMRYIVSGAGSRLNNNRKKKKDVGNVKLMFRYPALSDPSYKVGSGLGGFVGVSINATAGMFNFYGKGSNLMQASIKPRNLK